MSAVFAARRTIARWDWPTLALLVGVVVVWTGALLLPAGWGGLAFVLLVLVLTLHSSLSHEILHGHPFGAPRLETALGLWQPGLFIPYLRFRDLHLAHHRDANLTDPYDDPESYYLDPAVWARLGRVPRALLSANATLAGRIVLGPLIGMVTFWRSEAALIAQGDRAVLRGWVLHLPGSALTLGVVAGSGLSVWTYLAACYGAMSVLKIRTFLEHRAHVRASGRTVIIEDRGPLAFLFLNNNLHVIHHMHPDVSWYRLWPLYRARRARFLARNDGYFYASYGAIFREFLFRRKEPVAHPLWQSPHE